MYILYPSATGYLNKVLELNPDKQCQDWDIELADANRIEEFTSFYQNNKLSNEIKLALMALIIASYDDLLDYGTEIHVNALWDRIKQLIMNDIKLFNSLLCYWSCIGTTADEYLFKVTPQIRDLYYNS